MLLEHYLHYFGVKIYEHLFFFDHQSPLNVEISTLVNYHIIPVIVSPNFPKLGSRVRFPSSAPC